MRLEKFKIYNFDMWLDHDEPDGGVSNALKCHGQREKAFMALIKREVKPNDVCCDIGANIGYCSLMMKSRTNNLIHAFEPNPQAFNILIKNIVLNKANNIKQSARAVSDKIGELTFNLADKTNLSSVQKRDIHNNSIKIPCINLDAYFKDKEMPNFVKMDIEGHEVEALRGMRNISAQQRRLKILIEVHQGAFDNKAFTAELKYLFSQGFKTKFIITAGSADINEVTNLGYQNPESFDTDNTTRHMFKDISDEDAIHFATKYPHQIIRSMLLVKKRLMVIVNDSDHETVSKCQPFYQGLNDMGVPVTTAVFCKTEGLLKDDTQSLADKDYVKFLKALKLKGNEIAYHGFSDVSNTDDQFRNGIDIFKKHFGTVHSYIEHGGIKGFHNDVNCKAEAVNWLGADSNTDNYVLNSIKTHFKIFCPTHLTNHLHPCFDNLIANQGEFKRDKFVNIEDTNYDIVYTHFGYVNEHIGWNYNFIKFLGMVRRLKDDYVQFVTLHDYFHKRCVLDDKYDKERYEEQLLVEDEVIKKYIKPDMFVLDLGCGDGRLINKLSKYAVGVEGFDINISYLNWAKKQYPNVKFIAGNMINYNFEEYDCIVSFGDSIPLAFDGFTDVHKFINELLTKTKLLIFSYPTRATIEDEENLTFKNTEILDFSKINCVEVIDLKDRQVIVCQK